LPANDIILLAIKNFTVEIHFFVMFYKQKNAFITPLHLLFLFTNKREVLSSAQTDQSLFSFSAGFRHEIERALIRRRFLAPEKSGTRKV